MKKELVINAPKGINEVTNQSDILTMLDEFREDELEDVRFTLLLAVRKDGSAITYNAGFVSPLELKGLQVAIQDFIDEILSNQEA